MAFSKELARAFNEQITLEFMSIYEYLQMSAWFEAEGLPGFAHWMRVQSEEEWTHAMKFLRFLVDRGGRVELGAIPAPRSEYESPLDVFEQALEHEQGVTKQINAIYAMAMEQKDFASLPLLDWFVNEQVEEEASVQQMIEDLKRVGSRGDALLMLDREAKSRAPAPADAL